MMKFYFVRHGTTLINQAGKFNGGNVDSPLTPAGEKGAKKLGKYLSQIHFQACYASPQNRALKTAQLLLNENQATPPQITILNDLREIEIDLGNWDGTRINDHRQDREFEHYFHHPDRFDASQIKGESFPHLIARGGKAIQYIYRQASKQDCVLVASHGVLLTSLINTLLGVSLSDIRSQGTIANTSVTILSTTDGQKFKKIAWNIVPDDKWCESGDLLSSLVR